MSWIVLNERECLRRLDPYVKQAIGSPVERYYSLGGIKNVRIVTRQEALFLMDRQLGWVEIPPVENPDATVFLWQEESLVDFPRRAIGITEEYGTDCLQFVEKIECEGGFKVREYLNVDFKYHNVLYGGDNLFYYAVRSLEPEEWRKDGHLFAKIFYRILKTPHSSLVHSACVGLNGNGILFCAKAMRGKSTLTVASMLDGMEYVSDDYLILHNDGGALLASPIYSFINLSPKMYRKMYDSLDKARFLYSCAFQDKYTLDISAYSDRIRKRYPVKVAMIPVIDPSAARPQVVACTEAEKGAGITQLIHSTISQIWDQNPGNNVIKLSAMLRPLPFYKIILSPDIFANVECLRSFADKL